MKRRSILALLLLLSTVVHAQQDAQFSQYMFNGIYINPAYAGYKEQMNLHAFYRSQWTGGLEGNPETFSFVADAPANNNNVGLAVNVLKDQLGAESTLSGYLNYAYRLKVNEVSRLSFGLGAGLSQYTLDGAKLKPNQAEDPSVPQTMQSVVVPDIRAGLYYNTDRFYAGLSTDNLIAQYMSYTKDPTILIPKKMPHYYLTAGTLIPVSGKILLKPSFMIKEEAKGPTNIDLNAFVLFSERLWLGASYRTGINFLKSNLQDNLSHSDAVVALAELYISDRFRVGYAYDFSFNKFSDFNYGTHEISVGYSFIPKKIKMLTPRYF
ncbi:PorP/SprF family type IX secretion system membrane protein [Solitalea koreensis]|uniref:Type IX secretion system membrane protein, PorP/SprF family n=1 Tax=Solitalea koreensis TaxID=543615 RepID=A0A521D6B2_9SPHI|nr:type IX secretion system membrane protein PorP/SprF [Solitalea koreensis]SMO67243.1 type IX secretion system membrane protein, PorP/SprF family [Solitalea koreensis]